MVIGYDMSWISRQIIGRLVRTDTVTLVNLVSETREVPEFIGPSCTPSNLAKAVFEVLESPEKQLGAMRNTMQRLGKGETAPGERAAQSVLNFISQRK